MKFIKLHDKNNEKELYIKAESIICVYYNEEEKATAVDYGSSEFYVKETASEVYRLIWGMSY